MHYLSDERTAPDLERSEPEAIDPWTGRAEERPMRRPAWDPERLEMERGSVILQWLVVALLLGFVGLALLTPHTDGHRQETPAYAPD